MHRDSAITRRQMLFACAALVSVSVSGCGPSTPFDATLPPPNTATPVPPTGAAAVLSGMAATSSAALAITMLPPATATPTLPPLTTDTAATGTALSGTSAVFSRTATAASPPTPTPANTPAGLGAISTGNAPTAVLPTDASTVVPTSVPTPVLPTTVPATQTTVDKARTRFDTLTALHFTLAVDGQVYLDPARTERLTAADGDLIRPDRVSLTARISVSSINAQLKFIQIADMPFLTNILTGRWQVAPAGLSYDPRIVFDPNNGVTAIMGRVNNWTLVDMATVSGTPTQHLRGVVPMTAVNALVTDSLRGDYVDVDVYIEGKNNDILKFVIAEQPAAITDGTQPAKWTLDLSKQNEAITINAPMIGAQASR